jgi:hypothetical protein
MAQGPDSDNVIGRGRFPPGSGGPGPNDPTVELRLARLESAAEGILKELQAIRVDIARMDGKISNLPSTFQLVFTLATFAVATFVGATGLSLAIVKLTH